MLRVGTLFSGIGAPEEALRQLGIPHRNVFACEVDKFARQAYLANHKVEHMIEDIADFKPDQRHDVDMIIGGSPCQSFSNLGGRAGFGDCRGGLFFEFIRIVEKIKPEIFIWENVKAVTTHNGSQTWNQVITSFNQTGYSLHYKVLNAKDYGLPQSRPRLFLVGFKAPRLFSFPLEKQLSSVMGDYLEQQVAQKYYATRGTAKKILKKHVPLKFAQVNGEIAICQTARQFGNQKGNYVKNSKGLRRLTPRECLRLMGFSDEFKIACSDSQTYKQSGNSMAVPVLKALIQEVI